MNPDKPALRGAATIVFNPLSRSASQDVFCASTYAELVQQFASVAGLRRKLNEAPAQALPSISKHITDVHRKRGLARLEIERVGEDLAEVLDAFLDLRLPCLQADFLMSDSGVESGVARARSKGFIFCGWLPGYRQADVLRLQRIDAAVTDTEPGVINPAARDIVDLCRRELDAKGLEEGQV